MKIAVIGGGITGLYVASQLSINNDVHLFEANSRLGGRVHTVYKGNNVTFETGAGRFNKNHKRLFRLLRKLNLVEKVAPISNERKYYCNGKEADYNALVGRTLFDVIVAAKKNYTDEQLKAVTLKDFMITVVGSKTTDEIINAFGYQSEFETQNAYTSLHVFEHDFNDDIQYYGLNGGLSQITIALHTMLRKQGCKIHMNTNVVDFDPHSNMLKYKSKTGTKSEIFSKVVFCVTKDTLSKFDTLLSYDGMLTNFLKNSIESAPLNRMFAQFPLNKDGTSWFSDINRFTTNTPIRYVVPLNASTGLLQISYTDRQYADMWNEMSLENAEKKLLLELRQLFPSKKIPKPLWIEKYYWKEGATYWKPNYVYYNNQRANNYYIAGEMTSKFHTAWIEGALESAERVLRMF